MADYRMLAKLQEIRRRIFDELWLPTCDSAQLERFHAIESLLNEAIDLDNQMSREKLGLDPVPPEANAGSFEQHQHIKAQHVKRPA